MIAFWLDSRRIDAHWETCGPHLERFERETQVASAESIRHDCKVGDKQLWAVQDSAASPARGVVVTQVVESPKGRICEIYAACGVCPKDGMHDVLRQLKEWAARWACTHIRIYGRVGWQRVFKTMRQTGVILEERL